MRNPVITVKQIITIPESTREIPNFSAGKQNAWSWYFDMWPDDHFELLHQEHVL